MHCHSIVFSSVPLTCTYEKRCQTEKQEKFFVASNGIFAPTIDIFIFVTNYFANRNILARSSSIDKNLCGAWHLPQNQNQIAKRMNALVCISASPSSDAMPSQWAKLVTDMQTVNVGKNNDEHSQHGNDCSYADRIYVAFALCTQRRNRNRGPQRVR